MTFFSCSAKEVKQNECSDYPPRIKDLKSEDLYDSARWILFNWQGPKKLEGIYYGEMELRYKDVVSKNDSIEIFFIFTLPIPLRKSIVTQRWSHGLV